MLQSKNDNDPKHTANVFKEGLSGPFSPPGSLNPCRQTTAKTFTYFIYIQSAPALRRCNEKTAEQNVPSYIGKYMYIPNRSSVI